MATHLSHCLVCRPSTRGGCLRYRPSRDRLRVQGDRHFRAFACPGSRPALICLRHAFALHQTGARRGFRGHHSGPAVNSLRHLREPLVLLCYSLYIVNRWLVKPHLHLEFFTCWFNDLLLIPCALPPLLILHEWLGLRPCGAAPTGSEIFWHLAFWSLLFEWIGPRILKHSTGDPLDVLAYSVGALIAYLWWQRLRGAATSSNVPATLPS